MSKTVFLNRGHASTVGRQMSTETRGLTHSTTWNVFEGGSIPSNHYVSADSTPLHLSRFRAGRDVNQAQVSSKKSISCWYTMRTSSTGFRHWDISVICPKYLKNLSVIFFVSGFSWRKKALWPNYMYFFLLFKKRFGQWPENHRKKQLYRKVLASRSLLEHSYWFSQLYKAGSSSLWSF